MKRFRKENMTGIKGLSIGTTKNTQGHTLHRYTVTYKDDAKIRGKSFYFGVKYAQKQAYLNACEFMTEIGLIEKQTRKHLLQIYDLFNHENDLAGVKLLQRE